MLVIDPGIVRPKMERVFYDAAVAGQQGSINDGSKVSFIRTRRCTARSRAAAAKDTAFVGKQCTRAVQGQGQEHTCLNSCRFAMLG